MVKCRPTSSVYLLPEFVQVIRRGSMGF